MISLIQTVLQNRAMTGDGNAMFLPEPTSLTIRVKGDAAITSGAATHIAHQTVIAPVSWGSPENQEQTSARQASHTLYSG
jgi:hypothetical protein